MTQEMIDGGPRLDHTGVMANKTVLVCDGDELARRALGRVAADHGLEVSGEAATAVQALQLLRHSPADVVVITHELQGLSGLEVTPELVADGYRVVLVSADPWVLDQARTAGAFGAVRRGDLESFAQVLSGMGTVAAPGERRSGAERRSNPDRRVAQDWSKVIRERRVAERRVHDRRQPVSSGRPGDDSVIDLTGQSDRVNA